MLHRSIAGIVMLILFIPQITAGEEGMQADILRIQHDWANIKYQWPKHDRRSGMKDLLVRSKEVHLTYPKRAEPLIWHAVVLYTYAGNVGGLRALSMVKKAHGMLLEAEKINPEASGGYGLVALGSLYYKTPGYPIAFGDEKKADIYLRRAIALNPDSLDAHYFMGDFLLRRKHYAKAVHHLEAALKMPPRLLRSVADAGRKADAWKLLEKARKHLR
ncbi:MAG: hypothetical protein R8K53_07415 [Mariprofundaceae bacterium]